MLDKDNNRVLPIIKKYLMQSLKASLIYQIIRMAILLTITKLSKGF